MSLKSGLAIGQCVNTADGCFILVRIKANSDELVAIGEDILTEYMKTLPKPMDFLCDSERPDIVVQTILDELVENVINFRELTIDLTHLTAFDIFQKLDEHFDLAKHFQELDSPPAKSSIEIESCPIYLEDGTQMIADLENSQTISVEPPIPTKIIRKMPFQNKKTVLSHDLDRIEENVRNIPMITRQQPRYRKQVIQTLKDVKCIFKTNKKNAANHVRKPRKEKTKIDKKKIFEDLSNDDENEEDLWSFRFDLIETEDQIKQESDDINMTFDEVMDLIDKNIEAEEFADKNKFSKQENCIMEDIQKINVKIESNEITIEFPQIYEEVKGEKKRSLPMIEEKSTKIRKIGTRKSTRLNCTQNLAV